MLIKDFTLLAAKKVAKLILTIFYSKFVYTHNTLNWIVVSLTVAKTVNQFVFLAIFK